MMYDIGMVLLVFWALLIPVFVDLFYPAVTENNLQGTTANWVTVVFSILWPIVVGVGFISMIVGKLKKNGQT